MRRKPVNLAQITLRCLFVILSILCIYPFWHCIVGSLMTYDEYMLKVFLLYPDKPTLASYRFVFDQGQIFQPLMNTCFITVVGTIINLCVTSLVAYGLSKQFPGKTIVVTMIVITMFVGAGLIPYYILFRQLSLLNKIWVYIIPSMINTFYLIIMRTYFYSFSHELEDSAMIDGLGEFGTFVRIVLPLSKPMLATIALFTAVDYWNTYAASLYFVSDYSKKTLQNYLAMMLNSNSLNSGGTGIQSMAGSLGMTVFGDNIKLANTVVSILPILLVYPFAQRYFISGIMLGALKG